MRENHKHKKIGMKKKFLLVITILTTICILLILCLYFEAKILSGIRAYVRGEGLYSKGQKDAVIALTKYVRTKKKKILEILKK